MDEDDVLEYTNSGVVGGGALRGELDYYSMADLKKMRVSRLKSMCEARYMPHLTQIICRPAIFDL